MSVSVLASPLSQRSVSLDHAEDRDAISSPSNRPANVLTRTPPRSLPRGGPITPPRSGLLIETKAASVRQSPVSSIPRPSPNTPISPAWNGSPTRTSRHARFDSGSSASRLSRSGSLYTLSRSSFSSQLSQLTSIEVPNASALLTQVGTLSSAQDAAAALSDSAVKIRQWIRSASDVLKGLDANDDIDWAAAAGSDGLDAVAEATRHFESLINVYISAVDNVQSRSDVSTLDNAQLRDHVVQLESVVADWQRVKDSLQTIKSQQEVSIEWAEMSNTVIGDIGSELDALSELVFEMEEQRHASRDIMTAQEQTKKVDIDDLAIMVGGRHESPRHTLSASSPRLPHPSSSTNYAPVVKEDANMVALSARLQPLRASLDFLPMRLSTFHVRGNHLFPTACIELESRRDNLEEQWKRLESDVESLRRELGEDRWISVFRNAGYQALRMFESIERSQTKLQDAINDGIGRTDSATLTSMIESYAAKKTHYVPAVQKVLTIIDRGVLDRLTVNGEILGLQSDMKRRWTTLSANMRALDVLIGNTDQTGLQPRDSVSSVQSSEHSFVSSTGGTSVSSPASSIIGQSGRQASSHPLTPATATKTLIPQAQRTSAFSSQMPQFRSSALKSSAFRSVTSPSPRRLEPRAPRESISRPSWNFAPGDQATNNAVGTSPSPRKYTPQFRATQDMQPLGHSVKGQQTFMPSPPTGSTPTDYSRSTPRSSLPPRAISALGTRSPTVSHLYMPRTRAPMREFGIDAHCSPAASSQRPSHPPSASRNHSVTAVYPTQASRQASFSTTGTATPASGRRSSLATPRQTYSRASRRDSRPGTSMGHGNQITGEKPRWMF